jgi:tRNA-specific 2-thiouridylase
MRVVVAMSGGVDSSVVAGLLSEQGHEVIGVTLQLYDHGAAAKRRGACCAGEDIHDAKRVADRLGIAHYVIDAEARFRATVMEDFAAGYAAGETPVPCVRCNQSLKFGDLIDMARDLGAEAMAPGHYVRRSRARTARNCTRPWTPRGTRAGFSSPRPARSSPIAAFLWATCRIRPRCGPWRRDWASPSR